MQSLLKEYIKKHHKLEIFNLKKHSSIFIKKLASGSYNLNYLVKIDSKNFLFRLSVYSDDFEGNKLNKEYALLKKLNGLHAPRIFYYDEKFKYPLLIEEFVEGKKITKLSNSLIRKIARALAEIHLSIKPKSTETQPITEYFISRFKRLELIKNPIMYKILSKYVGKAQVYIKEKDKILQRYQNNVLLHGDMHCSNILLKEKKVVFVDWENTNFGDPSLDLVAFFYESENLQYFSGKNSISKEQKELFLREYLKINPDPHLIQKIKILYPVRWLSDTLWLASRIVDYNNIPSASRDKLRKEYINFYNFNLKRLQHLWK